MPAAGCSLPKPSATEGLRSLSTPGCFRYRPDSDQRLAGGTASPFAAFGRGKVLQLGLTPLAVHTPLGLGAIPKTTAPLANFQMHAQKIHDEISMFLFFPDGFAIVPCFLGVERTGYGCSGFLCPDGG